MTEERIGRMNELWHKSKTEEGLTEVELAEQKEIREEYMTAMRKNLRGQLDQIKIKEADGSITDLGKKYGSKK